MPKSKRSRNNNYSKQLLGNGTGPSRGPSVRMLKKLQYTETMKLDNATSTYSYLSEYIKPDITKATGASVQFAAYELWRIKKMRVSIQNSSQSETGISQLNLNDVSNTTIWTAADFGANETISGETIMQYQNAKKNTLSLNNWKCVVDTPCRINGTPIPGVNHHFIYPAGMWISTSLYDSSSYSGYQLFVQNFGSQSYEPGKQPAITVVTELIVEFMQPAFQNNASSFSARAFGIRLTVQPDSSDLSILRTYLFNWFRVHTNSEGKREFEIHLVREDGESGSLTYNNVELREAIHTGTSGKYFNGRRALYDGPVPPLEVPELDFSFGAVPSN